MLLLPSSNLQNTVTDGKSSSECSVNRKISSTVKKWCKWINKYASDWDLDPFLIAAIIQQESGGDSSAISKNGAVGLMQIMPGDGKALAYECISGPCFLDRPSTKILLNPEYNISYGTEMIAGLLGTTGNLRDALRAYGPNEVGYA
jgi:soluble lytic murein transglycosylase-like protein